jgi:hypothetical protein
MKVNGTEMYMTRGDNETITLELYDQDDVKIPLIEGDKVYFTVKTSTQTSNIIFQKIAQTFTEDDEAVFDIVPEDTKDLRYGDYVYDIQLTTVSGRVITIIRPSKFVIGSEVTYE